MHEPVGIMPLEVLITSFLTICLGCFFSVNLLNILKAHRHNGQEEPYAEVEDPSGFIVSIAALGTLLYFVEVCFYVFVILSSIVSSPEVLPLSIQLPFLIYVQVLGLAMTGMGYSLLIWSVIARERYATSWKMRGNHRLVTWGPYRYVRHPSYFGYFLMFLGFITLWPNIVTLMPLAAIPGYIKVTVQEEKLLEQRFGDEYREYQRRTGRFIPKF